MSHELGLRTTCTAALVLCLLSVALLCTADRAAAAELLMFEAKDCHVCRRFNKEVAADYPSTKGGRVFPLRRVDIHKRTTGIMLNAPVTMTPTFVFASNGVELARFVGYPGRNHFIELVDAAAKEFLSKGTR